MKGKRLLLVASASLILMGTATGAIVILNTFSSAPLADGPKLFIPGCGGNLRTGIAGGMYLGEGKPGDTLEGDFNIQNAGSQPLTFQLKVGCVCASLNPSEGLIQPAQSQEIKVTLRLRKKGQNETFSIWITTNDPNLEMATYPVSAKCPKGFFADPGHLDFGNVHQGTGKTKTVRIHAGLPGVDLHELKETVSSASLKTTTSFPDSKTMQIKVELPPSLPLGPFFQMIRLRARDGEEQSIPVNANICKTLIASPTSFFLSANLGKNDLPKFSCLVRRFDGKPLGKLRKVECPAWLKVTDVSPQDNLQYRLVEFRVIEILPAAVPNSPVQVGLFFHNIDEFLQVTFSFLGKLDSFNKEDNP
jgi:hypothetical protein